MELLDASQLAKELAPMLLPLLPYLVKGLKISGEELAKALGKKVGEEIPNALSELWKKLDVKFRNKPGAYDVIQKATELPQDARMTTLLEAQLEDVLQDEILRNDVGRLLAKAEKEGVSINQVIQVGRLSGVVTGVDVNSPELLKNAGIKSIDSKIHVESAETGSRITGLQLNSRKKKK